MLYLGDNHSVETFDIVDLMRGISPANKSKALWEIIFKKSQTMIHFMIPITTVGKF